MHQKFSQKAYVSEVVELVEARVGVGGVFFGGASCIYGRKNG
jgi:hypothetical protein